MRQVTLPVHFAVRKRDFHASPICQLISCRTQLPSNFSWAFIFRLTMITTSICTFFPLHSRPNRRFISAEELRFAFSCLRCSTFLSITSLDSAFQSFTVPTEFHNSIPRWLTISACVGGFVKHREIGLLLFPISFFPFSYRQPIDKLKAKKTLPHEMEEIIQDFANECCFAWRQRRRFQLVEHFVRTRYLCGAVDSFEPSR